MESRGGEALGEAIEFVNEVRRRFQDVEDGHNTYREFLRIMNKYRDGRASKNQICAEITALFRYHPDLLHDFSTFSESDDKENNQNIININSAPKPSTR